MFNKAQTILIKCVRNHKIFENLILIKYNINLKYIQSEGKVSQDTEKKKKMYKLSNHDGSEY